MSPNFKTALLCATSLVGLTATAYAQDASKDVEAVVVTGSRLIQDITLSPTPITAVTAEQLSATTPTDIPDALNKLPVFLGGRTPRTQDNGSKNNGGNVLALRNFGTQRTLILLDGHRVPASNQDGTVDVDTLPQMLMSRVDVVTGGASAVYGSDAVAGVVNFILDKKFEGFKYNLNAGISKYTDAAEEQLGVAWGTQLFGGRGHFEMAARYFNQDMVPDDHRPYGYNFQSWVLAGSGSAAAPFTNVPYGHTFQQSQNGRILCGSTCSLNNYTFKSAGVASPMTHGVPTTTSQLESGGDGGYNPFGTFRQKVQTKELFGRFSYDLTDDINWYAQSSWAESNNYANWSPVVVSSSANRASYFFANNPYLSAAAQTALAGGNYFVAPPVTDSRNGSAPPYSPAWATTPIFSAAGYQFNTIGGTDARAQGRIYNTIGTTRNIDFETGLSGTLGSGMGMLHNWAWDVYYNHADDRTTVKNPHNTNNAKFLAAEDAVIAPAGTKVNGVDVSGTVTCWVTTQTTYAALYPGCQPINAFDPNGPSAASFDYMSQMTFWTLSQTLDNAGGSLHGGLGFGLPAGEITAAVSAEARWNTYKMKSNASPTDFVNCTGLRLCQANIGAPNSAQTTSSLATASPALWTQNVNAPVDVSNNVYEFATEINVPLVKNVPLMQDVSLDVAGRYTNYSSSGEAYTWKIGGDWHVNETVRFRSTISVDIRAPNLNDLYAPSNISSTGQTDLLTGGNTSTQLNGRGNPNLIPEVAHSYTAGLVLTPDFIPGLSLSVDWYTTHMSGAITSISYQSTVVQNICLQSAPAYNSPFCSLAIRPITNPSDPNFKNSNANFPTQVLASPLNASKQYMEGWDIELDYSWDMDSVVSGFPGTMSLRHLLTYQPVNTTIQLPGATPTWAVQPKTRQTTFLAYQVGDWGLNVQNQWLSGMKKNSSDPTVAANNQVYAQPRISSYNVLDVTIDRKFGLWGGDADLYFNVSNIGNTRAPLYPTNASNPGLFYPIGGNISNYYDDMGRYFTIGLKGNL